VFSASAIVPLGGDAPAFMDYVDDVAAAPQTPATPAVSADFDGDGAVDGADLLIWKRGGQQEGSSSGPVGGAADAVMEQLGHDPQGIIAILIGLYAPQPAAPTTQALELENTLISGFQAVGVPQAGNVQQSADQAAPNAPQPYLLKLENTMVSSLVSPRDQQSGILHEDNEFSFPRM
jgi:hypothetical protein